MTQDYQLPYPSQNEKRMLLQLEITLVILSQCHTVIITRMNKQLSRQIAVQYKIECIFSTPASFRPSTPVFPCPVWAARLRSRPLKRSRKAPRPRLHGHVPESGGEITHAVLNGSIVSKPAGWDAFHGLALAKEKLSSEEIQQP